ncbi:MAG: tetratricopeptide repeat protein [Candidatus Neomarinimicrobiota bacterium]
MDLKPRVIFGFLVALLLAVLIVGGCREQVLPEAPDYVEYGWELLTEGSYRAAITQFEAGTELDDSYADGWNGLGWAYAKLGIADTSADHFSEGVGLADTSIVGTEILAGRSFARLALGSFSGAVDDGKAALSRSPTWVFRRDVTVTYEHVTLTVATGFYSLGEFDSCLVWIRKLDDTFTANVSTLSGRSRLAAKLETLEEDLRVD